jgi:hypothetical protein
LLAITVSDVNAQEIYKSVDDEGNVTYSEEPPTEPGNVEILDTAPEPSTEEVEAAQSQIQELESTTNALKQEDNQQTSEQQASDGNTVTRAVDPGIVYGGAPVARHNRNKPHARPHRGRRGDMC